MSIMDHFIALFLESAPWLLLGLILAGMLKVFVPMSWMNKQLGGHGFKATLKAALFGAPLPLCSCGVIPAAVGLRRSGASKAATTSFLVSTPETGVDSVTVSYVLLGPFMAIVRPIAAITSAIVAGLLVGRDEDKAETTAADTTAASATSCCSSATDTANNAAKSATTFKPATFKPMAAAPLVNSGTMMNVSANNESSCCGDKTAKVEQSCCGSDSHHVEKSSCCSSEPKAAASCCSSSTTQTDSCCSSDASSGSSCCGDAPVASNATVVQKLLQGLKYAATDLIEDTAIWLLVGLFFAALVQTYVPADFLAQWGNGLLAMLVMVLVSIPMYICATASTPIAAGLLLAGVSPGAVLVFMLAGPATNIATLGVVAKEMGRRALFGYLGGVLGVALVFGWIVNILVANFGFEVMPQLGEEHRVLPDVIVNYSAIILAVLMAKVLYDKLPGKSVHKDCCS
ncbi:SO_0444 family Cu/Zn efflux transporter [Shewanella sp. C32]|uniref:SO_0444 family Cu/Zn efflux transporter n=1 Tax=Shewanella electrica TaxID=515560 RepID=A0ABT2FPQ2_9GAMM|nr:SO_0444 family Cu/Zn efflux transporter [Shewanella electrica]MCH1926764.1 SO_0444 family Cu/Zn efflux transporter [Shewanella electrica]MCS4558324.1 SO_0444 family Cu/Zn efflux transporter [Shewanella electrica]